MSRQIFGKTPDEAPEGETPAAGPAAPSERRAVRKPLMGLDNLAGPSREGQPVGALSASLAQTQLSAASTPKKSNGSSPLVRPSSRSIPHWWIRLL